MSSAEDIARERWGSNPQSVANLVDCFVVCSRNYAEHGARVPVENYRSAIFRSFGDAYKDYLRVVGTADLTYIDYYDELGVQQAFCEVDPTQPLNEMVEE